MTVARRVALITLGVVLTLLGQTLFLMMCGPNSHLYGALLGALGGAIIGVRRRARTVRWFATGGGILLALVAAGMQYLSQDSCAGAFNSIGSGAFTGFGIGLIFDGARPSAPGPGAGPPPGQPQPPDGA